MLKKILSTALSCIILLTGILPAFATNDNTNSNTTKYILGADSLVNTGKDTGYAEKHKLDKDDPHWGWQLGDFYVSDFTRQIEDSDGNPVFLKNVGDTVTLWFSLEQNIDRLNKDDNLRICEDTNGWDKRLGVDQTNFGHGMLIVKYTDYQNKTTVTKYQNFLSANATTTADTEVEMFEEGDYEIALDYEIEKSHIDVLGVKLVPTYYNYRITFKFSIRNGNCMVFPFDVETGAELTNTAITENGFYLDLANSRYLDIDIRKDILNEGADGLVEDTRFNKPARDGSEFTDEGIYTITVHNRYTDATTEKVIYVGTNSTLKAHVVNDLPISEINLLVASGATIAEDGTINMPEPVEEEPVPPKPVEPVETKPTETKKSKPTETTPENETSPIIIGGIAAVVLLAVVIAMKRKGKGASK